MVAAIMPRPEVMDSSTTMAFSGRVAPTAAARPGKVISPSGRGGRSAFPAGTFDPLKGKAAASASSAPAASSPGRASLWISHSGDVSTLFLPGEAK